MINQTLSLLVAMYEAIGPGLFLVAALPFLLVVLGIVFRVSITRLRSTQ